MYVPVGRSVLGLTVKLVEAPTDRGVDMLLVFSSKYFSASVPVRVTERELMSLPSLFVRVKDVGWDCSPRCTVHALEAGDAVSREPPTIWSA